MQLQTPDAGAVIQNFLGPHVLQSRNCPRGETIATGLIPRGSQVIRHINDADVVPSMGGMPGRCAASGAGADNEDVEGNGARHKVIVARIGNCQKLR